MKLHINEIKVCVTSKRENNVITSCREDVVNV